MRVKDLISKLQELSPEQQELLEVFLPGDESVPLQQFLWFELIDFDYEDYHHDDNEYIRIKSWQKISDKTKTKGILLDGC